MRLSSLDVEYAVELCVERFEAVDDATDVHVDLVFCNVLLGKLFARLVQEDVKTLHFCCELTERPKRWRDDQRQEYVPE